ncbi:hypothetical protein BH23GEM10_BH23GEM10_09070 [soil metagenome]
MKSRAAVRPASDGLVRALMLSVAAAAVPISGTLLFPESLQDYEALTWLTLLVPAFLWAYERGWRGVATALALGMATLSTTYAIMEMMGGAVPDLLLAVVVVYIVISLAIGLFGDRVARAKFDAAAETLALQDPFTGLPNRRHAELHLEMEFAAAERGRTLAVVLFDIDHFKAYNAHHGRAAGDGVLKGLATLLRQHTRRMDLAARYGPEEFVSVLGGCSDEGAVIFAGRVQERLRAAEHTVALPTISAGVACYRPEMHGPSDLLREAEEALAQAKREGRDRVRIYGRDMHDLQLPDNSAVQRAAAEAAQAEATALLQAVQFEIGRAAGEPMGRGRSAFVLTGDVKLRAHLADFLHSEQFQVVEGTTVAESIGQLQHEFDVVFLEVAANATGVADLVRQIRLHTPLTRVVGLPRPSVGGLAAEVLDIRVDSHFVPGSDTATLRARLQELLQERDALKTVQLRHRELSNELRTKDREARAALEASEAKYRSVVQTVQEVIFTTDAEWRWMFLNPAWTAITGFDVTESAGRPVFAYVHADEVAAMRQRIETLTANATPYYRHEGRWRTRTGMHRWIELRMQLTYTPTGEFNGASGVITDVTDRREAEDAVRRSEEYFRSLIESAADMVAVLTGDGTIRYVSPAVERVLGFPPDAWEGTTYTQWLHPDDIDAAIAVIGGLLEEPDGTVMTETRVRHRDGSWREVEATCRNLLLTPGVEGLIINARDVTERHRAEQALRESAELLLRAQKMDAIGRLAGGVAHDFNNLLTAILGHADLLIDDLDDDVAIRDDLLEIRDAAGRATSLTRQLLAFSRRQVMQPRVLDLNAVVRDMEKMLKRAIGEHVALRTDLATDAGAVRADPAQIEQVLLNLIVNARDAMPRGGQLTISTSSLYVGPDHALAGELTTGAYALLRVTDTGTGMAPDVATHAFEPFFTTKEPGQGTGLGLATVYGVVKQSGGHIWLDSEPEAGTEVNVLLPGVAAAPEPVSDTGPPAVEPVNRGGSETILLVEDEKAVRDLAVRILDRQGYDVMVATNGREALEIIATDTRHIDLLLTDVVMPELNGQDLAAALRSQRPDIPVLFMSGYNEEAILRDGVLAEGASFLEKPFSPAVLLERIRSILDRQGA